MDSDRLRGFVDTLKRRAAPLWQAAVQLEGGLQWMRLRPQAQATLFSVGMGIVALLLFIFSTVTAAVAAVAAWIALLRHFAQTNADRQRRITESFARAIEHLGSDKLEVRLGGIYSLERISKESPDDYWTVMESLCAFVREGSRRNETARLAQDVGLRQRVPLPEAGCPTKGENFWEAIQQLALSDRPAPDIAAVLTVITRRGEENRQRERANAWYLDLAGAVLRGANLRAAHFERADLTYAHFEGAALTNAHLEGTFLVGAHFEGASLKDAHFKGAFLESAFLEGATNLLTEQLVGAFGDAATQVPAGLRPAHWPPPAPPGKAA